MSTADPEPLGCNHNYMCNKYICSSYNRTSICAHTLHTHTVCKLFCALEVWRFGNRLQEVRLQFLFSASCMGCRVHGKDVWMSAPNHNDEE